MKKETRQHRTRVRRLRMGRPEVLTTRQVAARIRVGTLPRVAKYGVVFCLKGHDSGGETENLKFWSKGDRIGCGRCKANVLARPRFLFQDVTHIRPWRIVELDLSK